MTDVFKRLGRQQPGTTAAAVYTVPAAPAQAIVREIRCVNTDLNAAHTLSLYESGSTDAEMIEAPLQLQPGETRTVSCFITLAAGEYIAAKLGDATGKVNVIAYGLEIT